MDTQNWFEERFESDWQSVQIAQRCELYRATPAMMDAFWADGWRHFGEQFFRDMFSVVENRLRLVLPLRIDVSAFTLSDSQRRAVRRNTDVQIIIGDAYIDEEKRQLFERHRQRFRENVPDSLRDFLSPVPSLLPCVTRECCVYDNGRLVAVSFFDVGETACSSVYAMFDPAASRRSLGVFTLLQEIRYAQETGRRYLYLGYSHREHSHYDYKKQFAATEFYNWRGEWLPLEQLQHWNMPTHPIESIDVSLLRSSSGDG
jgi:arginyl-tRNA--protein-N-Asp/Glu arginylyltransferase